MSFITMWITISMLNVNHASSDTPLSHPLYSPLVDFSPLYSANSWNLSVLFNW